MLSKKGNDDLFPEKTKDFASDHVVNIEQKQLQSVVESICQQCRYPLLALRILIHAICSIDSQGRIYINARQLSRKLGVHYDTLTKCLKFLREIDVLRLD